MVSCRLLGRTLKKVEYFSNQSYFFLRNYKNAFEAIFRIARDEGIFTLWRGALPTMGRAMVVNAAQLASYSQAKQLILQTGNCDITFRL